MTDYYEAILQLRNIREEILAFVNAEIKSKNLRVAKITKQKNGFDFYLPSKKFTANIGKKLVAKFGGKLNISTRLFGKSKTGKTLYRATILYAGSDFIPGDIVQIDNKIIILKSIGKFVCGYDIIKRENAKIVLKGKEIKKLKKFTAQVTKNYPHLEVLNPETYESVAVLNSKPIRKSRVSAVATEKGIYIIE